MSLKCLYHKALLSKIQDWCKNAYEYMPVPQGFIIKNTGLI
jgi:hypothetical protein